MGNGIARIASRSVRNGRLRAGRPGRVVTVALANKMPRVAWALLVRGKTLR